jgi:hypothetical protein
MTEEVKKEEVKVEEVTEVALTQEEVALLEQFGKSVEQQKHALGELRVQYLRSEAQVLQAIANNESQYMEHLKRLAAEKGLDLGTQRWEYNPQTGVLYRR